MNVHITGRNVEISDTLYSHAEKKLKKLDKYFQPTAEANVVMSLDGYRHIVEITLFFEGLVLRAEETSDDMYSSLDNAVDKVERQIHRHKTRLAKRLHSNALEELLDYEEDAAPAPRVVRTKRFAIKPLSVEEATLQIQLLGHDFYVFRNAESNEINVIYRRRDGDLGLIDPVYNEE